MVSVYPPNKTPVYGRYIEHFIPSPKAPNVPEKRKLKSWVGGFFAYTQHMGVPPLWRRWAALSTISGALERRCTLRTVRGSLAPNMFVLLVSPPGVGKSVIINEVLHLWQSVEGLRIAPSAVTRAGLIDTLIEARKVDVSGSVPIVYHSLLCASPEFGNLVPQYDNAWFNILNDLYDCGKIFSDVTRQHGEKRIEHPHLTIIAGTQPKYLDILLPDAAFGMGFTSRLVLVYAGEGKYVSLFENTTRSVHTYEHLRHDLGRIAALNGDFYLTPEAIERWESIAQDGFAPIPQHSKLTHYNARRAVHLLKIMMCLSASERDDLRITEDHVDSALSLLHETERLMPQIFSQMVTKGYADANEELLIHIKETFNATKKPIQETALIRFLVGKVPNQQIKNTIDLLVQGGQLRVHILGGGARAYAPI